MKDGLKYALCALSFFKTRHGRKPRFKNSKRKVVRTISCYKDNIRMARGYIVKARIAGWRGSIIEATMQGEHLRETV